MLRLTRRPALLLCLLALWLQMLAPALALGMQKRTFDPLSAICHAVTVEHKEQERNKAPPAPSCDHCALCHASAGALSLDERPDFTLFDYPVVSPLRWASFVPAARPADPRRGPPPRGPPIAV